MLLGCSWNRKLAAIRWVDINNKAYWRMTGCAYGCSSSRVEDGRTQNPYDAPKSPRKCIKNGMLKCDISDDGFRDLMRSCSLCGNWEAGQRERQYFVQGGRFPRCLCFTFHVCITMLWWTWRIYYLSPIMLLVTVLVLCFICLPSRCSDRNTLASSTNISTCWRLLQERRPLRTQHHGFLDKIYCGKLLTDCSRTLMHHLVSGDTDRCSLRERRYRNNSSKIGRESVRQG